MTTAATAQSCAFGKRLAAETLAGVRHSRHRRGNVNRGEVETVHCSLEAAVITHWEMACAVARVRHGLAARRAVAPGHKHPGSRWRRTPFSLTRESNPRLFPRQ